MARKIKKDNSMQTSAQQLGNIIKSARDIMRKDKGLSGELDRLPMLTWLMFLKFIDDAERVREQEAFLAREKFRPAIEPPYRWRDWAEEEEGITGDELISFINNEKAFRLDGTEGPGLLAYLKNLQGGNGRDRRDVLAAIFKGTVNRMINGYLLRDLVNKISDIHFDSSEEIHTLSHLYESMLKEMRDAAGDSGEFYTPRPVVRFMVEVIAPELGDTILDPACGTGGFLVESFKHLMVQCHTVEDLEVLQKYSIQGGEAKPLPYMLAQMNLLLSGMEYPQIDPLNSLRFPLHEIGEKDRVDIVLTNPPFGGEEEDGILGNFPEDKKTKETSLLFLQLIMRKLKRQPSSERVGDQPRLGRAGVVVPNGFLFSDGVTARIKEDLLRNFNLHTIVRLPMGVFAPYTNQETNLMFFEWGGPTNEIWYYEHPLPAIRMKLKNPCYTKSNPLIFEELEPLLKWWNSRESNDYAWKVPIEEIISNNYNLDIKHPKHAGGPSIRTSREVGLSIRSNLSSFEQKIQALLDLIGGSNDIFLFHEEYKLKSLSDIGVLVNPENRNPSRISPDNYFRYVDLASVYYNNIENVKNIKGSQAPSRARRVIREDDVIMSTVRPYLCGHAVVPTELDNEICSTGFAVLRCPQELYPLFLYYMLISPGVINQCINFMRGAHYPALNDTHVKSIMIPDIPISEQIRVAHRLREMQEEIAPLNASIEAFIQQTISDTEGLFPSVISDVYEAMIHPPGKPD